MPAAVVSAPAVDEYVVRKDGKRFAQVVMITADGAIHLEDVSTDIGAEGSAFSLTAAQYANAWMTLKEFRAAEHEAKPS